MSSAEAREAPLSPLELAPHARRSVRSARRTLLVLGLIVLALGLVIFAILLGVSVSGAARPEDGVPFIAGITFVVAVLPGFFLTRAGLRSDDRHPLVVALEQDPALVRTIGFGYSASGSGYAKVATVTLKDGFSYSFEVPAPSPDAPSGRAPRREPRPAHDGTIAFSGRFVGASHAASGLLGEGTITVGAEGLVIVAARERLALARGLGVLVGAVAGALSIGLFVEMPGLDDPRVPAVVAIVAAVAGWAGTESLVVRALPPRAVRVVVPWSRVTTLQRAGAAVELSTTAPELAGISRFVTDHPDALVRARAERSR